MHASCDNALITPINLNIVYATVLNNFFIAIVDVSNNETSLGATVIIVIKKYICVCDFPYNTLFKLIVFHLRIKNLTLSAYLKVNNSNKDKNLQH